MNGNTVFNGQDSVLYVNMRLAFPEEIKAMYQKIRNKNWKNGAFSYEAVEKRFADHQSVWGEALFNEDSRFKYIEPLITKGVNDLPMLQGSKASQRQWWLYNRFRYLDSKYNTGDSASDYISFYAYVKEDLYVKPYADIYAAAKFDSEYEAVRALRSKTPEEGFKIKNKTATTVGEAAKDQVVTIYSASQLADIGDLSKFKIGRVDFSKGTKLSKLKVGDGGDYENPNLTNLTIGNLTLLTELDVRNCTNLEQTVDVSGCTNIEHIYFEGTKTRGVTLPNGGILKTLHLPSTVENLTIRNQPLLTDFEMPSYENLTTLRLENLNVDLFDTLSMILQMPAQSRVRVLGVEWNIDTPEEIFEVFDKLDSYRGLDEYGNNVDKPQISGIIHTGTITSNDYAEMMRRYPNFTIDYEHITSNVQFFVEGVWVHTAIVYDGADCPDPIGEFIDTPTKEPTVSTEYVFDKWDKELTNVTADRIVNATFTEQIRKYTITFLDDDGSVIQSSLVSYDTMPFCENPTREDTAQYFYDFDGWDKAISKVTCDETYRATYIRTLRTYTVTWVDEDGSRLLEEDVNVPYGKMPSYDGETPTKQGNAQYTYTFAGWHIEISEVKGDITYKATYTEEVNKYTVIWKNYDGTVLETDEKVPYGDMPEYNGSPPTKEGDAQYSYSFLGWDTAVSEVTGDVVYTAVYTQHIRSYTIKFVDYNSSVLKSEVLEYGSMPTAPTPSRTGHDFTGWDSSVATVTGDKTYTAQYTPKMYTITWVFGSQTKTTQCAHGSTPTPPSGYAIGDSYTANGLTYTCTSWGNIVTATSNATYTATVQGSGSITSRFSRYALGTNYSSAGALPETWNAFLAGTNYLGGKSSDVVGYLYGFDFRELNNFTNVNITDIKATVEGYLTNTSSSYRKCNLQPCTAFRTDNTDGTAKSYTSLSNGTNFAYKDKLTATKARVTRSFKEADDLAQVITWANSNLDKLIGGYDSNSFGIRINTCYMALYSVELTVEFTFG